MEKKKEEPTEVKLESDVADLLELLRLDEIRVPLGFQSNSLYYSLLYWEKRNEGLELFGDRARNIHSSISALQHEFNANNEGDGTKVIQRWAENRNLTAYILGQKFDCVFPSDGQNCAIFRDRTDGTYCPLIFKQDITHPTSARHFIESVVKHLSVTLKDIEKSESQGSKELHIALGAKYKWLVATASSFESPPGARILFFGAQGAGKSYLINRILEESLRKKQDHHYASELAWYYNSFQAFKEVSTEPVDNDSNEERDIYASSSTFIETSPKAYFDYYLLQEGSNMSTTCVTTTVTYGIVFAMTIEFVSEREAELQLRSLINYNRFINQSDEADRSYKALNMIGFEAEAGKIPKDRIKIDPHFRGKLGHKIKFSSPHFSIEESLNFLKAKYHTYCAMTQYVWGLVKSVQFELPVPLLRSGGQLVDCPGLVVNDQLLQSHTEEALNTATAVIYVFHAKDVTAEWFLLENSTFMNNYKQLVEQSIVQNNLREFKTKCLFLVHTKDWKKKPHKKILKEMNENAKKMLTKIRKIFKGFVNSTVTNNFPPEVAETKIDEIESMLAVRHFKPYLNFDKTVTTNLSGIGEQLVTANYFPTCNNTYTSPFPVTHVFYDYKKLSTRERGVKLFMNFLAQTLCENQQGTLHGIQTADDILGTIDIRLRIMSMISEQPDKAVFGSIAKFIVSNSGKHISAFSKQLSNWYAPTTAKIQQFLEEELQKAAKECTFDYLKRYISQLKHFMKDKEPDERVLQFINKICLGTGEFSFYSLSELVVGPLWNAIDVALTAIGNTNFLGNNEFSLMQEIDAMADAIFLSQLPSMTKQLKKGEKELTEHIVEVERNKFALEMRSVVKQYQNLQAMFGPEKNRLKAVYRAHLLNIMEQEEEKLKICPRKDSKANLRSQYVAKILPDFVTKFTTEVTDVIYNRITKHLRILAGTDKGTSSDSLVAQMNAFFASLNKQYSECSLQSYDYSKLQSYFRAIHMSVLHSALHTSFPSNQIYKAILDQFSEMDFTNYLQTLDFLSILEWNSYFNKLSSVLSMRWGFEEMKFLAKNLHNLEGDLTTQSTYMPAKLAAQLVVPMHKLFPLANGGELRTESAIRNMMKNRFGMMRNAQLAINYVDNNLNRFESLRIAFNLQKEADLQDLNVHRVILGLITNQQFQSNVFNYKELANNVNNRLQFLGRQENLTVENLQMFLNTMRVNFDFNREEALKYVTEEIEKIEKKRGKPKRVTMQIIMDSDDESDQIMNDNEITVKLPKKRKRKAKEKREKGTKKSKKGDN